MTIRKLPELRAPARPSGVSFELSERAVSAWAGGAAPTMADSENVITILEVIGLDWWTGEGVTAKRISAALRSIGTKPVTVVINSPGGDFFEGVAIYNLLRGHPEKVTVKIVGIAASAASVIAMAADEIQIAKFGFMMIHNTQWMSVGDRHAMLETHDIMEVFDRAAAEMYADRSGQSVEDMAAMLDAETWLAGQAVIDEGLADALLDVDQPDAATAKAEKPALYRLEAALASGRPLPRSERRKLLKQILDGTPGAAAETARPRAGEAGGAEDGHAELYLALTKLKLATA